MAIQLVPQMGLLLDGHTIPPAEAVTEAEAWLRGRGVDEWAIYEARPGFEPRRAWWDAALGFVGDQHEGAVPVTVIHLPSSLIGGPALAGDG